MTVIKCYFTNNHFLPAYTVVFNIQNFTNITVTDSVFQTIYGINLVVISVMENVRMTFNNCTFNKISGFRASHNTIVQIKNSRITNCKNTIQTKGLIEISYKSLLYISNSNITDNKMPKKFKQFPNYE